MNRMLDASKKIHEKYEKSLQKASSILIDHFNINKFYYGQIHASGVLYGFDSNFDFMEQFETTELYDEYPFHCHPKYHKAGIHVINVAENLEAMNMPVTRKCMRQFGANMWIRLVEKTENGLEEFGFHSEQSDDRQAIFLVNQASQLRLFAEFFLKDNLSLMSALKETPVNFMEILGSKFYENTIQKADPTYVLRQKFLEVLGMDARSKLSDTELDTLKLICKGYSAAQIARQVFRSKRTIEHRIEGIKLKLACSSKQELVQKALELEHFGY